MARFLALDNLYQFTPAEKADIYRLEISKTLDPKEQSDLGQYLTPLQVAEFMASLFYDTSEDIVLLDPGAGTGTLTAAFIQNMAERKLKPQIIRAICYELDLQMASYLEATLKDCEILGKNNDIDISGNINNVDFINWGVEQLVSQGTLFETPIPNFSHCIMNPPYKKIRSDSEHSNLLRRINVEASNLYSAFLSIAIKLLSVGGELVAIVPRSFCNGPYFRSFRKLLIDNMRLRHIHVFVSRNKTFKDANVLQENIIIYAVKVPGQDKVIITSSDGPGFETMTQREVPFVDIVKPNDPDKFIHIAPTETDQMVVNRINVFSTTLDELNLDVSTGPVVDFRLREDIRQHPLDNTYPLIYPSHISMNFVEWPNLSSKKPNAIQESDNSKRWLMDNGWYVVVRRFSSKEERRRIVAAIHSPERVPGDKIGFENHLNVFHHRKKGLDPVFAKGLATYLNSSLLDRYFRQFSGHTQVNATDLRMLHYPDAETLIRIGSKVQDIFPEQEKIDMIIDKEIDQMANPDNKNPLLIQRRVDEAMAILKALDLPKGQQNERSALTLLALINLEPRANWNEARSPLIGITPIMDYIADHYGKSYAPNTRETIRRQTMHQFLEAGIAIPNPDKPSRPTNSPKWCYQISPDTLNLLHKFGSESWSNSLKEYLEIRGTLAAQYAKERDMEMIPLELDGEISIRLSPGSHSQLIKDIVTQFGPRYAPGAEVLYIGDTGSKMRLYKEEVFKDLGLIFDSHGKFPDVVLYLKQKNWLLLIESVTSHGPVDAKRHAELDSLFAESSAGIVYITAFPDRQKMAKYLGDISWETEVWIADAPSHLIHFNGERFLGPYQEEN